MLKKPTEPEMVPGGFTPQLHWRVLGTPAPVFPGFEVDICDPIPKDNEPDAVWHRNRAKQILQGHPEVKELFGPVPLTSLLCLAVVALQFGIAIALVGQSWWMIVLAAWCFGAMINYALFNLAHECNHSLVFRNKTANRVLFTITSLPMLFPGHHTWWIEHHVHHNHLGSKKDFVKRRRSVLLAMKDRIFGHLPGPRVRQDDDLDDDAVVLAHFGVHADYPGVASDRWTGRLCCHCDLQSATEADRFRVVRYSPISIWFPATNATNSRCGPSPIRLVALPSIATLWWLFGWVPIVYLFLSALFMTGFLHPLAFGLMLSNSHFHGYNCYQPSASNYGSVNWITFNFGMHTEHHDFHYIPWFHLGSCGKSHRNSTTISSRLIRFADSHFSLPSGRVMRLTTRSIGTPSC